MAYGYSQGGAYSWKKFGGPRKPASELKSAEARAKREQSDRLAALPPPRPVTTLAQMSPEKQEEMRRLYPPPTPKTVTRPRSQLRNAVSALFLSAPPNDAMKKEAELRAMDPEPALPSAEELINESI